MEYLVDGKRYVMSYQELREEYRRFCKMGNKEFLENLPAAAHLACIICFLKQIPTSVCLADTGIVHELLHLMHIPEGNTTSLKEVRKLFKKSLKLA